LLSQWSKGHIDEAVATYFHLDQFTNKAMREGKRLHLEVGKHILGHNSLPDWLPDFQLSEPKVEEVVVVKYNDLFDLKAIYDWRDKNILYEFKTGVSDSLRHARSEQIPFYFLVAELKGIPIEKAYLIHYNQHIKKSDFCVVWNNKSLREKARNFIDTVAIDAYDFFKEQGLV